MKQQIKNTKKDKKPSVSPHQQMKQELEPITKNTAQITVAANT